MDESFYKRPGRWNALLSPLVLGRCLDPDLTVQLSEESALSGSLPTFLIEEPKPATLSKSFFLLLNIYQDK